MPEIQKHYLNVNGDHFVAVFKDQDAVDAYVPPEGAQEVPERPSPDYIWQNDQWVYVEPPAPEPEDYPLTMRQLRLGLLGAGYAVDFIRTTIDAIPDITQRAIAQIWYEETSVVLWNHEMTQTLIAAAGISSQAAAAMWLAAKDIPA